jgi:hypothetical protein
MEAVIAALAGAGPVGVVAAVVLGLAWIIYRSQRDRLVTTARRDEGLLPGVLEAAAVERREWQARVDRVEQLASEAREAERECMRRCDDLAARLAEVEARCGACTRLAQGVT